MTTKTTLQLAAVLGLGLGSAAVGYAQPRNPSTSASPCEGTPHRECEWDKCTTQDTYDCFDVEYEVCEKVDDFGTIVCRCIAGGVKKNLATYPCC
jgi:hypothetical protein